MQNNQSKPAERGVGRPKKQLADRHFQIILTQQNIALSISGADIIAHFGGSPEQLMAEINQFIQSKTAQNNAGQTEQLPA